MVGDSRKARDKDSSLGWVIYNGKSKHSAAASSAEQPTAFSQIFYIKKESLSKGDKCIISLFYIVSLDGTSKYQHH